MPIQDVLILTNMKTKLLSFPFFLIAHKSDLVQLDTEYARNVIHISNQTPCAKAKVKVIFLFVCF